MSIGSNKNYLVSFKVHKTNEIFFVCLPGDSYSPHETMSGFFHRVDGPAVMGTEGDNQWWINGKQYTEEEFKKYLLIKEMSGL